MILYRQYKDGYHVVRPDQDIIDVSIQKPNDSPWCPFCVLQERRMVLNGKTYSCLECGKSFPVEYVNKDDMQKEEDELLKLMRLKLK
jgi:hypothetical protein